MRAEVSRPVGNMNAVEQAIPARSWRGGAKQRLGRRRDEQDRAVLAVARDDVRHVAGEQTIAMFLGLARLTARQLLRNSRVAVRRRAILLCTPGVQARPLFLMRRSWQRPLKLKLKPGLHSADPMNSPSRKAAVRVEW